MQVISKDNKEAYSDPLINEFEALVKSKVGDGVIDFEDLLEPPFMKYWKNLVILRYMPEINDFKVTFYGSHIVSTFGKDCTGMLTSAIEMGGDNEIANTTSKKAVVDKEWVYISGDLAWQGRDFRKYNQLKIPLKRIGQITELVMCINFIVLHNART